MTSPRTPRHLLGWTVPDHVEVVTGKNQVHHVTCRHIRHEGGYPGRIFGEDEPHVRGVVGRFLYSHAHGQAVEGVSEVLPETPEPPREDSVPPEIYAKHQYNTRQMRDPDQLEDLCTCGEWVSDWLEHHAEEAAKLASQSVPAVPVSSTGGKETGEAAETATEALRALIGNRMRGILDGDEIDDLVGALAGWRPPLPACDCEPFTACPHIEQADPNEQAAIQLGYCEASVQASSDPEDGEQCPNLREPGYVNCQLHRSSPLPDSEQRGVWQSPDGVHLAVEAEDGELEWLECDPVGGWLLRGMLDMVPDEWVRLVPLPDSETEWGWKPDPDEPDEVICSVDEQAARERVSKARYRKLACRQVGPWIEVTS